MTKFLVTVDEHTITTYEVEAEDPEDIYAGEYTLEDEKKVNEECLNYSITKVEPG